MPATTAVPMTAKGVAERVVAVLGKGKVVVLNEDNDPNDLLGRPNGYLEGASIQWLPTCSEIDVQECGGSVEIWPNAAAAQRRAKYIQTVQREVGFVGSEYTYVKDAVVLRISGNVKPSQAKKLNVIDGELVTAD